MQSELDRHAGVLDYIHKIEKFKTKTLTLKIKIYMCIYIYKNRCTHIQITHKNKQKTNKKQ